MQSGNSGCFAISLCTTETDRRPKAMSRITCRDYCARYQRPDRGVHHSRAVRASGGSCSEIASATSGHFISEFSKHLRDRYERDPGLVVNAIQWLRWVATVVEPVVFPVRICCDPEDDPVLGRAVAAGARVLVTLDNDLLVLGIAQDVQILTPMQLMSDVRFVNPAPWVRPEGE